MSAFANKQCVKNKKGNTFKEKYGCKDNESVKKCYLQATRRCHPDKHPKDKKIQEEATKEFINLQKDKEKCNEDELADKCDLSKLPNDFFEEQRKEYENYDERWKEARERGDVGRMISIQTEFFTFLKSNTIKLVFAVISSFILLALMDNEEGVPSVPPEWDWYQAENDNPFPLGGQKGGAKGWFKKTVETITVGVMLVLIPLHATLGLKNQLALNTPIGDTPQDLNAVKVFNDTINTTTLRVTEAGLYDTKKANEKMDKLTKKDFWGNTKIAGPNTDLDSSNIKYEPLAPFLKNSIKGILLESGFSQQEIDLDIDSVITTIKSSNDLAMKFANSAKSSLSKMGNEENRAELLKDAGAFNTNIFNYKDKTKSINIEAVKELSEKIFDVLKKHCFGSKVTEKELKRFLNPTNQMVKYTNSSDPKSAAEIHLDQEAYKLLTLWVLENSGLVKMEGGYFTSGELQVGFQQILSKNLEQCVDLFYIVQQLDFLIKKGSASMDMTDPQQSIDDFVTTQFRSYSYELDHARALQNSLLNTKKNVIKKIVDAASNKLEENIKSKGQKLTEGVGEVVLKTAKKAREGAITAAKEAAKFTAETWNEFLIAFARQTLESWKKDKAATLLLFAGFSGMFYLALNFTAPCTKCIKNTNKALEASPEEKEHRKVMKILNLAETQGKKGNLSEEMLLGLVALVMEKEELKKLGNGKNNNNNNIPDYIKNPKKNQGFFPSLFGSKNKKKEEDEEDKKIKIPRLEKLELEDDPNTGGMKSKKRRPKKVKKTRKKGKKKRKDKKSKKRRGKKVKKTRKKGKKKRKGKKSKRSKRSKK